MKKHTCLLIAGKQVIYLQILKAMLRSKNCEITVCEWDEAIDHCLFTTEKYELIVILQADTAPVRAAELTDAYLKQGGKIIALGAPVFEKETYTFTPMGSARHTDRSREKLLTALDHGLFHMDTVLSFEDASVLDRFVKDTSNPDSKEHIGNASLSIVEENGKKCLKWQSPDFYINENFEIPITLPRQSDALTFYTKAKDTTRTVTLTLVQTDGFFFKTTFLPGTEWNRKLLTAKDFRLAGGFKRGMRPTSIPKLSFDKVCALRIGHAVSHAYSCAGEQYFYIDEIAAARIPFADRPHTVIPGMYPAYKYYPVTNAVRLVGDKNQGILSEGEKFLLPKKLASASIYSVASGLDKGRRYRFIPIIEAIDRRGLHCGYAAHMLQFYNYLPDEDPGSFRRTGIKDYDGGMLCVFTPTDNRFYCQGGCKAVCDAASFMLRPIHLLEGGSAEYAYFSDDTASKAGAYVVVADGTDPALLRNTTLHISGCGLDYSAAVDTLPEVLHNQKGKFTLRKLELPFDARDGMLTVSLSDAGKTFDRIGCEVLTYTEKPQNERRFAKVAEDASAEIEIGGNITRFYGVNYMPSGCIANEDGEYHEFYFSRMAYDPNIIRTDLERIADIGMNAVSVFLYHRDYKNNNNLLHFIALCQKYGIYIDLGLRPRVTPFQFDETECKELITTLRLQDCDTIVGYDISWERYNGTYDGSYGNYFGRKSYDPAWRDYLIDHYQSFEAAEAAFGEPLPRNEAGEVIGVSDAMLRQNEAHRILIAVYRKFVDEHVRKAHDKAASILKKYDPNHIITARTGDASTIPLVDPGIYGYDYRCLAPGIDFYSPESYALSEDHEILRQILFTNEYTRFYNPNAVVQWKEFGKSIWCGSNFTDNRIGKEIQANFYRKFFDMLLLGHTGGVYAWWWAGGYRIGENSDFGVINPDGSDREVTGVLREYAPKFLMAPLLRPIEGRVAVDRSAHPTGLKGYYRAIEQPFFAGWEQGKRISFAHDGFGKSTLDTPVLPFYADGAADSFIKEVAVGETVTVTAFNPAHRVWERNVSLVALDENRNVLAACPLNAPVELSKTAEFTLEKDVYEKASMLALMANGDIFGHIYRIC